MEIDENITKSKTGTVHKEAGFPGTENSLETILEQLKAMKIMKQTQKIDNDCLKRKRTSETE